MGFGNPSDPGLKPGWLLTGMVPHLAAMLILYPWVTASWAAAYDNLRKRYERLPEQEEAPALPETGISEGNRQTEQTGQ